MKKQLIFVCVIGMMAVQSIGQTNFKWDKVDSVNKTKSQIYSDTKMFIAQTWKSAQDVIQNDDKETGSILIKGSTKQSITYGVSPYNYFYNYTITFLMKDNKVRIILENVTCSNMFITGSNVTVSCLPTFEGENYPNTESSMSNLSKKKQRELMFNLKNDLQLIVDSYTKSVKAPSVLTKEW